MNQLPITTRFRLGDEVTAEQAAFLDHYGFLHFEGVAASSEIAMITAEMDRIEAAWLSEGRTSIYGIPLFFGRTPDGLSLIHI